MLILEEHIGTTCTTSISIYFSSLLNQDVLARDTKTRWACKIRYVMYVSFCTVLPSGEIDIRQIEPILSPPPGPRVGQEIDLSCGVNI
jgi:hypothetical protein